MPTYVAGLYNTLATATGDPDGGASTLAIEQLKTFLTGTLAIAFFALVVAGIGIAMGVKWLRKAQSAS